jgi:hypothetical protein
VSRWLSVTQLQEPMDTGPDNAGYPTFSVNCLVLKEPSDTVALEAVRLLVDAGVGTYGVDIFTGSEFEVPADRPSLAVSATGGIAPLRTHSSKYKQPGLQLMARAPGDSAAAEALATAAIAALADVQNADVTPHPA